MNAESKCPYKPKVKAESKCPYKPTENSTEATIADTISQILDPKQPKEELVNTTHTPTTTTTTTARVDLPKCPFEAAALQNPEDEEDLPMTEGCPVSVPKELNSNFNFYYEIPYSDKNDFYFDIMKKLDTKEFLEQTKTLRAMPRHLRNSLFLTKDQTLKAIHEREFTIIYFIYEEIRQKATKFYRQAKFRQLILKP